MGSYGVGLCPCASTSLLIFWAWQVTLQVTIKEKCIVVFDCWKNWVLIACHFGFTVADVVTEFIEGLVETYPGLQYLDGFPEVIFFS